MIQMNLVHIEFVDKDEPRERITAIIDIQERTIEFDVGHLNGFVLSFSDIALLELLLNRLESDAGRLTQGTV